MAESSWPTTAGSRAVLDQEYEAVARAWSGSADGIIGYPGDTTTAYADASGRQVKVRSGKLGQVRGRGWYSGTSDNTLSVTANSSGSTRTDLLVLRLTRSTWAASMVVKAGTPGAGNPALTQDATSGISTTGVWEVPILLITVVNGETSLSSGEVSDVAWYMQGDTVVCASTNPYQPSATAYTRLRHSDTGHTYVSVSSAWRREDWHSSWGLVGGKRYDDGTGSFIGVNAGPSEFLPGMDTGSLTLPASRAYEVRATTRILTASGAGTLWVGRIRKTNLAGALVAETAQDFGMNATVVTKRIMGHYETGGSPETVTFCVTAATSTGTMNSYHGDTTTVYVGIGVFDVGPSGLYTVV